MTGQIDTEHWDQTVLDIPTPQPALPLQAPGECGGCDQALQVLDADGILAPAHLQPAGVKPRVTQTVTKSGTTMIRWTDACENCWDTGYRPPSEPSRAEIVISNCLEHIANGVGLRDAAGREGYSDRTHLDSVLRRWGRRDVALTLAANDKDLPA